RRPEPQHHRGGHDALRGADPRLKGGRLLQVLAVREPDRVVGLAGLELVDRVERSGVDELDARRRRALHPRLERLEVADFGAGKDPQGRRAGRDRPPGRLLAAAGSQQQRERRRRVPHSGTSAAPESFATVPTAPRRCAICASATSISSRSMALFFAMLSSAWLLNLSIASIALVVLSKALRSLSTATTGLEAISPVCSTCLPSITAVCSIRSPIATELALSISITLICVPVARATA